MITRRPKFIFTFGLLAILVTAMLISFSSTAYAAEHTDTYTEIQEGWWEVPEGVTSVQVVMVGGAGGDGAGYSYGTGGDGGYLVVNVQVTPGSGLGFVVGSNGASGESSPAEGGTGLVTGGTAMGGGGGGGGNVALFDSDINMIAVSGGGGGGGAGCPAEATSGSGGNSLLYSAAQDGGNGSSGSSEVDSQGGQGAQLDDDGIGRGYSEYEGEDGSEGNGGNGGTGDNYQCGGGGGGSGYYGGGGGGAGAPDFDAAYDASGGGGGLSWVADDDIIEIEDFDNDGSHVPLVSFTYEVEEESTTTTSPESELPNGGDLNGDGTEDALQDNVVDMLNGNTNQWVAFEYTYVCDIESLAFKKESQLGSQDASYEYPSGLFSFTLTDCSQPTVTVSEYYWGLSTQASGFTARKFLSYSNSYIDLVGASLEDKTFGGQNVIKLTYSITDGGIYDNDQTVNGTIIDPAGLGVAPAVTGTLAATGIDPRGQGIFAVIVLATGACIVMLTRKRRSSLFT